MLETTSDCLISQIDKIVFSNQKIYILDSKASSIFIFDDKGKFLDKLDKRGQGNGEYINLSDFFIDPEKNIIHLYDGYLGNILNYDLSGKFIDEINIDRGYALIKLQNNDWLLYLGNGASYTTDLYNLKLYSPNYHLISKYLPFNRNMAGRTYVVNTTKSIFSEYNNELYILPLLSNIVYTYKEHNNQFNAKYNINFPEGTNVDITENSTPLKVEDFRARLNAGEIASKIHNFYKINDMIFFFFFYQGKRFFCLYNESLNKIECSEKVVRDNNNLFFEPVIYSSNTDKNKILSVLDGGMFSICKNLDKTDNQVINEINKSIGNIDDTNPILIWYNPR